MFQTKQKIQQPLENGSPLWREGLLCPFLPLALHFVHLIGWLMEWWLLSE